MVQNTSKSAEVVVSDDCDAVEQERNELRDRFWQAVERIRERNADKDPDEVLREVTEAVEEVRQEQYERTRRTQDDR
jgi:ElaB/YqjD/DUF883 family membrane-anchored ribosome-binding protein